MFFSTFISKENDMITRVSINGKDYNHRPIGRVEKKLAAVDSFYSEIFLKQ